MYHDHVIIMFMLTVNIFKFYADAYFSLAELYLWIIICLIYSRNVCNSLIKAYYLGQSVYLDENL